MNTTFNLDRAARRAAILESATYRADKQRAAEHASLQELFDMAYKRGRAALLRAPEPVEHEADYLIEAPRAIAAHANGRGLVHYTYAPHVAPRISVR